MAVDLIFAGLMVICLKGHTSCPQGNYDYENQAWVVKADRKKICGGNTERPESTSLRLYALQRHASCQKIGTSGCPDMSEVDVDYEGPAAWTYDLSPYPYICVKPGGATASEVDASIEHLARIEEIDTRFSRLTASSFKDPAYIPNHIYFDGGKISSGSQFAPGIAEPTLWRRSNNSNRGHLPRALSNSLKVTYDTSYITFEDCQGNEIISLDFKTADARVELQNYSKSIGIDGSEDNTLTFLSWYYRLGYWNNTKDNMCPVYSDKAKEAVFLKCSGMFCASDHGVAGSTFWPPVLGPVFPISNQFP